MDVFEAAERRAARGDEVVRLEIGQPVTPAPALVLERAHELLDSNILGYGSTHGTPELRTAIAGHYRDWYGVDVDPHRVMTTVGASGAFTLAFLAAFDPGDRVGLAVPGYPCYRNTLEALGAEVVPLMSTLEDNFQPTVALLEDAHRQAPLKGLIITSPSNPTGTMIASDTLRDIIQWCERNGVVVISDEIYHGLTYGDSAATALSTSSNVIVVNSFSKYFSMTGWRLGWLVVPDNLIDPLVKFAANLLIAPATLSLLAAPAAFEAHGELEGHLVRYRKNRTIMLDGLRSAGMEKLAPADGAFYVYADVSDLAPSGTELTEQWLAELGVAATPGTDFDPVNGDNYVRFSFCGGTDSIERGVELLNSWRW